MVIAIISPPRCLSLLAMGSTRRPVYWIMMKSTVGAGSNPCFTCWVQCLPGVNFKHLREIADQVGAVLMVDIAHFAGLVAKCLLGTIIRFSMPKW